jgi:hypothetical protein
LADTEREDRSRGGYFRLIAPAQALGFEEAPKVTFERDGGMWLIKRHDPPAQPQEFWCEDPLDQDLPLAIIRHGPWKLQTPGHRKGRARLKAQAIGTLLIFSRTRILYRKGGLDQETEEAFVEDGISIERDKPNQP